MITYKFNQSNACVVSQFHMLPLCSDQELDKSVFENVSEPIQRPRPTQLLLSHAPYRMLR